MAQIPDFNGFAEVAEECGPFDMAFLEIGAYNALWKDIHMGPENAAKVGKELQANLLFPIHWGTFALALHPWKEPIERFFPAAEVQQLSVLASAPGETRALSAGAYVNRWWEKFT